jgi:hypothetical protein
MTFDEQLKGAFDTITDLLREEISRRVQVVVNELKESAQTDRERAVTDAREAAARDAIEREAAAVAGAEARGREAVASAEARGREAVAGAEARGWEAVASAEARGREEGQEAGRLRAEEASRAAVDAALAALPAVAKPDGASNERLAEAVRSISRARSLSEVLDTVVSSVGREAPRAGLFLVSGGRLHGWRFVGFDPAIERPESLVLPEDEAGLIADAVRTNVAVNNVGGEGRDMSSAPAFAALPSGGECLGVPIALSDQVVAVLYADQGSGDAEPAPAWMDAVEVLVRHAARSLEALTAFKAARALMARSESPEAASGASEGAGAEEDASARRYARLLISEIKLYHEAVVVAGRRDRDLGTRLSGEIARARVLYEQRVPPNVRQRANYFHDELVRTLADGDAGLLELGS